MPSSSTGSPLPGLRFRQRFPLLALIIERFVLSLVLLFAVSIFGALALIKVLIARFGRAGYGLRLNDSAASLMSHHFSNRLNLCRWALESNLSLGGGKERGEHDKNRNLNEGQTA